MKRMWSKNELKKIQEIFLGSGEIPSIRADEIIENMSGYSASLEEVSGLTYRDSTPPYCGIVKNGNKLTIVFASTFKGASIASGYNKLLSMTLPSDIIAKILPFDGTTCARDSVLAVGLGGNNITLQGKIDKDSTTVLSLSYSGLNTLQADVYYFARMEVTFLLSDNLISE